MSEFTAANQLRVEGTFTYSHVQFRDEGNPVYLNIYLDQTFAPNHPPHVVINPHEVDGVQHFVLVGDIDPLYLKDGGARVALPADSKLCAQCYVTSANSFGIPSREDHGATSVDLRPVHRAVVPANGKAGGQYTSQHQLSIHTNRNRVTGVIALAITRMEAVVGRRSVPIEFAHPEPHMNVAENADRLVGTVSSYLETYNAEQERFAEKYSGTAPIKCPLDPSEVTLLNSEVGMPLVAFGMAETPHVHEGWWLQQLSIMADRQGFTASEYTGQFAKMPLERQAAESVALFSQFVQQITYVADKSDGQAIEMFGDALNTESNDCDGLGLGIALMKRSFISAQFPPASVGARVAPMLHRMQQIMSHYIPLLCIEGVSSTHVENMKDIEKIRVGGAHFAIKFLPHPLFAQYVGNWSDAHPLAQSSVVSARVASHAPPRRATVSTWGAIDAARLPVLVGEGTGMLYPLPGGDMLAQERASLYNDASMSPVKKSLNPPPGPSEFYQVVLIAFTTEFIDTHRTGTFRFSTPDARIEANGQYAKGATYVDLMNKRADLRLIPFGFSQTDTRETPAISVMIPQVGDGIAPASQAGSGAFHTFVPEFTPAMMRLMYSASKTRIPARTFLPVENPVLDYEARHPGLDRLCAALGTPKGAKVDATVERERNRERSVHFWAQPEVADSVEWETQVERHFRKCRSLIKGIFYIREVHSDTMSRWRITLRV